MTNDLKYKILTYKDVAAIPSTENNETLVDARTYDSSIVTEYEKMDMIPYLGETIYVRETVARKLAHANEILTRENKVHLKLVYGYRHPEVQEKYFFDRCIELLASDPDLTENELDALTHNFVAVPDVAGHPTGGAFDLTLIDSEGNNCDMGSKIADYTDPDLMQTFCEGLSEVQVKNRKVLHDAMVGEGFAPFYGEWWHFSYGDKEWASFYAKTSSLYKPINYRNK